MTEVRARYLGHPDGVHLAVPVGDEGEWRNITVQHGGELPTEIDGLKVPASFRDSLLEQKGEWTQVRREPAKTTTAAKADEKEA